MYTGCATRASINLTMTPFNGGITSIFQNNTASIH
jgi:hypothetical protein